MGHFKNGGFKKVKIRGRLGKLFHITEMHKNSRVIAVYRKKRLTVDV